MADAQGTLTGTSRIRPGHVRTASLKNSLLNLTSVMLLTLVGLAACDSTTAEQHYARAETSLADAEIRTAVIELKNALQKNPDFADARLLLGETHARLGDYASALKEFERALDLGLDNDRVRLGLLDAKVRLGRHQEVIGELEDTGALSAPFAVVLADAYLAGGDLDRAKVLYQQGLALSGGNLGLGSIAWQQGDLERAAHYRGRRGVLCRCGGGAQREPAWTHRPGPGQTAAG